MKLKLVGRFPCSESQQKAVRTYSLLNRVPWKSDVRVSVNMCNGKQCFCHKNVLWDEWAFRFCL